MNYLKKPLKLLIVSMLSFTNLSYANNSDNITVENPFVREVPPVAMATAAFMTLHNKSSKDIYLVGAKSSIAKTVELHTHLRVGQVIKMRQVDNIKIPANSSVKLKPGHLHIMLIKPTADLTKLKKTSITLLFKDGSSQLIQAPIKSVKRPNKDKMSQNLPLKKQRTLDLCVNYSSANKGKKKSILAELTSRNQLSVKDMDNLKTGIIEPSNTMCGMYMILGKPLQEKSRQLRVMVFKTVHVYPKNYFVTQMGMVIERHQRTEDSVPPSLVKTLPRTQAPPVKFISPGGRPMH